MALTNEDLLAISQLLDTKLKSELQPVKDEIRDVKVHLETEMQNFKIDLGTEMQNFKIDLGTEMQNFKVHLETEIQNIKLHLENVTDRNIQLLAENYLPAAKRYEKETAKMEAIQQDVEILKKVVAEHSEKLQKIS